MLTVEFTVMGIPCIGLNGGPGVEHNWAFSFQVAANDQSETDRYWNAIVGNGGQEITTGPFAETVEQLGGYYILELENLDDAIAIAARLPAAHKGTVEIRPIRDTDNLPSTTEPSKSAKYST